MWVGAAVLLLSTSDLMLSGSLWIYVVILAFLKKNSSFVYFVILSNNEVCFLSLYFLFLSVSSPGPPDCLSSQSFHLFLSLVSSSAVSEEDVVHASGFPSQGSGQPTGCLSFSWIAAYWRKRNLLNLETQGLIQLASYAFSAPFEESYDKLPGLQLLSRRPGSPICPVPCLPAPFQSLRCMRMIQMVPRTKVCLTESRSWYDFWYMIKAYLCQAVSIF